MVKRVQSPQQEYLFSSELKCSDVRSLPLITENRGFYEVWAPGSVYQPILLTPGDERITVGPGKLDESEEKFVRDLMRYLYPAGNPPRSEKTPLQWNGKDVWFMRNIEKRTGSFSLRVDDSDWFYPDFIIWILDKVTRTQTFGFVDPKGLAIGAVGGWTDYKIVSTIYMPHVVELQLAESQQPLIWEGEEWSFRTRGVLVSTSSLEALSSHAKFNLRDEAGNDCAPSETDFKNARIVFQKDDASYIEKVLNLLIDDTPMDSVLKAAAKVRSVEQFAPASELDYDLALRVAEFPDQTDCEFAGVLVREYLKPDASGRIGTWVKEKRRGELNKYSKDGFWGVGAEKAKDIRDHPTPCEELWKRKPRDVCPVVQSG